MINIKLLGGLALSLMAGFGQRIRPEKYDVTEYFPRGKTKPKQGASNPLRGYYNRHSHALTEYITEQNLRRMMGSKSKRQQRNQRSISA